MGTADRVLPWRRHHSAPIEELAPLLTSYRRRHPKQPVTLVNRAYETARRAHQNQMRSSGEAYINHPIAVARIVAEIGLDEVSLAAALLHDAVEDTEITIEDVRRDFGDEVAELVDGVTKLERLQFDSREEQQAATMRKMLVAIARDIRVLVIKLADRLHNMRTLAGMPIEKQQRVAQETLDIYAPLAHRLGMQDMKQQLEDLSFSALYPKRFAELDHLVSSRTPERDIYLAKAIAEVQGRLAEVNIVGDVTGRGKHLWSIYEKMVQKDRDFDEIFDLNAIRIIVDNVRDCYGALGCIHGKWRPVVGRFKDYIAMPKFNLYQSLHTTVIGPGGKPLEVQIRTREMHEQAEFGVAAHFAYKHGSDANDMDWLNRIIDWQSDTLDPNEFMADLKTDLEQEEVFVFTPKGRVITLPVNSTPVDFAYAVHTEVGHACIGARVNGRLVSLDSSLASGDTCEIFTSKVDDAGPSRDWLGFVQSPRARNKIKQWFSRERREDMVEAGREELAAELRREGLPVQRIWSSDAFIEELEALNFTDVDSLLAAIGEHHVSARGFAQRIGRAVRNESSDEQLAMPMRADRTDGIPRSTTGIHVEGLDDVLVRLSRCCTPVPGDDIIGFVTKGRGVSVHRADCANAMTLAGDEPARLIEVEWSGATPGAVFRAGVEVVALDRSRLLRDVANALSEQHVNIVACSTHTGQDRVAKMRFEFELGDPNHLDAVLRMIKGIDAVYDAYRIVPGGAAD
ncbi:MAG: bifunctional (p)ppGpp synthetase/guanosine-3',5'-bis(diphosphate) 3'-pyrophosphohydrolase [Actinobacteria bacterium]|nr:bifunctional (p)ppGpp synthetase/guanosine-3',5'-bis(diphosphate) 3'-pyrophosphohydrolase [Actinomycetota bacterium]NBR67236.1 bifunctional (p)ppGpp synthetase/guanosine-3',5'-bis(diphosphate) 3'-pyrophosphohydrolase [Actinomycetota bacterium]NBU16585.1 bifunctional (p)ppGpp synthetase/guanosine-3',5'-bis(diphosphate) 3'-pyrophosphohydrolase [Actinomycetota bacterium]